MALRQIKFEQRSFWRNPPAAFFTFAFPLMFLFIFNVLFGNEDVTLPTGQTAGGSTFYIPAIVTFSVISACYTNVAMGVTFARDQGILKRVRGTPLPAWAYVTGRIGSAVAIGFVLTAVVTAVGALLFGVDVPTSTLPGVILTLIVASGSFAALGLAITAAVPNADAAPAVVNASILPLMFFSDVFIPLDNPARWVEVVGYTFPVRHFSEAMQTAYNPFATGSGIEWGHLGVVALWGLFGSVAALRFFSWEPRR
ncbi:MAG TPA: ABC transporter permease [Actinomycetota bacterium]|nr:ABC transporter permease [Actinomycetota bacterium]